MSGNISAAFILSEKMASNRTIKENLSVGLNSQLSAWILP